MLTDAPIATRTLITRLNQMHPELHWRTFPLCDYDQYAEIDAPDVLVTFRVEAESEDIPDPFSTLMGIACDPSEWGVSLEAAELMREHNKVFVAKYPNCDGPKANS